MVGIARLSPRVPWCLAVLAFALMAACGCGGGQGDRTGSSESDAERLDRLRSLPYGGGIPASRSEPAGVILHVPGRVASGQRLYTVPHLGRAELITDEGVLVRRWEAPGDRWERAELLPDGALLVVGITDLGWSEGSSPGSKIPDASRYVMKVGWAGEQLWKRSLIAHHDIELLPDGNLLLLTFERRLIEDVHESVPTRDDQFTFLSPSGEWIESRSFYAGVRANPEAFVLQPVGPSDKSDQPWVDLFHSNSVEWMTGPGLDFGGPLHSPDHVIVSIRHQDRVAIYDWASSRFVWSWGEGEIVGPHDAQLLDSGNLLLFDNGLGRGWSRAVELDPRRSTIVWTYEGSPRETFYTASRGSVQRLPNGNTLMAESDKGRAIEVTQDGEIVWEFVCPYFLGDEERASIVRITHYDPGAIQP